MAKTRTTDQLFTSSAESVARRSFGLRVSSVKNNPDQAAAGHYCGLQHDQFVLREDFGKYASYQEANYSSDGGEQHEWERQSVDCEA